jgi:uncharacterized membrane protein YbhN (UPF0104 family)
MSSEIEIPLEKTGRRRYSLGWRIAAGAAILLGILATQRIEGKALWETLRRVDPALLAVSTAGFLLLMAVKSWRWNFLIRQAGLRYGFWPSFRLYLSAFSLGIVTPGRLGELARAGQLRNELGVELGPCVRSVVSDRLFDLVFLGAFGPFAFWAVTAGRTHDGFLAAGFAGLHIVASLTLAGTGKFVSRWQPRWRPLQFAVRCLGDVADDLAGRTGLVGSVMTLISYAVYFGASWILFRALGIHLSFRDVACVTGCLSLILLLPISIAGIGPREAILIILLGQYGISREDALAYSILQFAVFTLFGGLVGVLALAAFPGAKAVKFQQQVPTPAANDDDNSGRVKRVVEPAHEPTPSPLPGGEPATGISNEAPLLGGAGGGFMEARRDKSSGSALHQSGEAVLPHSPLASIEAAQQRRPTTNP